jgi:NAD(P)-dependent dehydrogenase (short-subunit alcohol dehydrogenase family)
MSDPHRPWVLITGCSTGIGWALVEQCRGLGWGVVATARSLAALEGLTPGEDLRRLALDVTRPESIAAAAAACADLRLTALVNNAGFGQMGPLELLDPEELRAQFETNVLGLHAVTRAFLPHLRRNAAPGEGRVVQVASVLGRMSIPLAGAYCASKHAVVALAEALRLEVAPELRVILVEPGAIQSDFRQTLAKVWGDLPTRVQGTPFQELVERYLAREQRHRAPHGLSAQACAHRIAVAMTSSHPPRRLVIGRDAFWANVAKALLPASLWEWAVRRAFGLR